MKNIHKIFIKWLPAILLPLAIISCKKDFLEVVPKGKVIASKTNDYNLMLNNENWISTTVDAYMGDDVCALDDYLSIAEPVVQRSFRYEDDLYPNNESPDNLTSTSFANLYIVNKVIAEVMDSKEGTETQKKALLAEAKAYRAWENLSLINRFAKPYNAATAATDIGFPIITTYDVTERFTDRGTVQQMYDFILKDLTEAIPDLSPRILNAARISQPAGEGLLAKVYWFMGKYSDALTHINKAFDGLSNTDIAIHMNDYNLTTLPGGLQMPTVRGPLAPAYPNGDPESIFVRALYVVNVAAAGCDVLVSPAASALYGAEDIRLTKFLWNHPITSTTPLPVPGMYQKVGFIRSPIGVTLPDLYLMRAECKARGNDLAGAIDDLQTLRKNRMPAADASVPGSLSKDDLTRYVVQERIREFAGLGSRWLDMRRLAADPLFAGTIGYTHTLYSSTGAVKETYQLKPERLTYQIPSLILSQNPGLKNNP